MLSAVIVLEQAATPALSAEYEPRLLRFLDLASPFKRKTLGKIQKMQSEAFLASGLIIPESLQGKRLEEL